MNALMMMAALAAGQCDAAGCSVEVTVQALVVAEPTPARRIAPVRNTAKWFRHHQPVRRLIRSRPVLTFLQRRQPLRRLGRALLGCRR